MIERDLVHDIITLTKKRLPRAVVLKHQDVITSGIPDISVSFNSGGRIERRTTWFEVKLLRHDETLSTVRKHFDKLQLTTVRLLADQSYAYYLVGVFLKAPPSELHITLISPHLIWHRLYGSNPLTEWNVTNFFVGSLNFDLFKRGMNAIINDLFYNETTPEES